MRNVRNSINCVESEAVWRRIAQVGKDAGTVTQADAKHEHA